jgi:hypothetical protein
MERGRVTSGLVMAAVGMAMVLATVVLMMLGDDALPTPVPVPLSAVGLALIAVGMRRHRRSTATRH